MKAKRQAILIMLGVFAAGVVVGSAGGVAITQRHFAGLLGEPRHEVMRERRLAGLARRLDLSDAQRDQVRTIMDRHGDDAAKAMREMFERCGDRLRQERAEIDADIAAVLDAEQRKKFGELSERHRRRFLRSPTK